MKAYPYVFFDSNCREAMEFYQALGIGTIEAMMANEDAPPGMDYDPARRRNILHAAMQIGDTQLLASDAHSNYVRPQGFCVHLTAPDAAEAERLFADLAEGGEVHMPMEETFWALRFGACADRFGIPWMISADQPA